MTAIYNLFSNPSQPDSGNGIIRLHARIVSKGTVSMKLISQRIEEATSFTGGDVAGVLRSLAEQMAQYLSEGYHVRLEGIGIFSASLKCRSVEKKADIRSASIAFSNVNFRPCVELMDILKSAKVSRDPCPRSSIRLSSEQNRHLLETYLSVNPCISRSEFSRITGCGKSYALKIINEMVSDGTLKRYGEGRGIVYFFS